MTRRRSKSRSGPGRTDDDHAASVVLAAVLGLLLPLPAGGQAADEGTSATPSADTLRLGAVHETVRRLDPRSRQVTLQRRATRARVDGIDGRWLPRIRLSGEGSYQTETATALTADQAGGLPGGIAIPRPPKDRYELAVEVEQLVWDGDRIARRRALERAGGEERIAGTRIALHDLRREADEAFFAALHGQERADQLRLLLEDLGARRRLVAAGVRAGTRLPAGLAAIRAEEIRARQDLQEAEAGRRAALERLSLLLDRPFDAGTVLSIPDLAPAVRGLEARLGRSGAPGSPVRPPGAAADGTGADGGGGAREAPDWPWSTRPEWRRLERTGERLRAEAALAGADDHPRVSAFLRGAVGRPGLDFFDDAFSPYAVMGVRVNWSLFDGGETGSRERALRLEARATDAEQEALGEVLRRRAAAALPEIRRLVRAMDTDDSLVALQEERRRAALRQLEEGVLLPSEYVERRNDVFEARLRRRLHLVRLAETRARLLRVLGRPVPAGPAAGGLTVPLSTFDSDPGSER